MYVCMYVCKYTKDTNVAEKEDLCPPSHKHTLVRPAAALTQVFIQKKRENYQFSIKRKLNNYFKNTRKFHKKLIKERKIKFSEWIEFFIATFFSGKVFRKKKLGF